MARYRKKPVEIDAVQWTGENAEECRDVLGGLEGALAGYRAVTETVMIRTLEGDMACPIGHWIIRGVKGEHYSCEPSIFALTYDEVK
jgi:chloramphenicol 3-O-phosphotransferase